MKTLFFIAVVVSVGCKNPNYCPGNPDQNCNEQNPGDGHPGDGSNSFDCTAPGMSCTSGVCDTMSKQCVACVDDSTCSGTSPICEMDACVACSDFTDCPTTACDSSGACATPTEISYVASATEGGTLNAIWTQAMPCTSLATAIALTPAIIRVKGAIVAASAADLVAMASGNKTIIGESTGGVMASFSTAFAGALFNLSGTANLTIYNLDLTTAGGTTQGIYLISGTPVVTVDRSRIENSSNVGILAQTGTVNITRSLLTKNAVGGLDLRSTSFDIENSFIVQNGGVGATVAGISIFQLGSGAHKIDFNTIAKNLSGSVGANGIVCASVATDITFTNNNITENTNQTQVSGTNCDYAYSNITGATTQPGTGNRNEDPMFVDDTSTTGDFHLKSTSTLRDKADPNSVLKFDFDSQARPQGMARDIGADELMP